MSDFFNEIVMWWMKLHVAGEVTILLIFVGIMIFCAGVLIAEKVKARRERKRKEKEKEK